MRLNKAIEKGLVKESDVLTDNEVFNLVLEPGLSTAKQVTDVSGYGIGINVIRRNIEALRGKIDIRSGKGKISVFSIRMPLTLAIIKGMAVRCVEQRYIIPTLNIV